MYCFLWRHWYKEIKVRDLANRPAGTPLSFITNLSGLTASWPFSIFTRPNSCRFTPFPCCVLRVGNFQLHILSSVQNRWNWWPLKSPKSEKVPQEACWWFIRAMLDITCCYAAFLLPKSFRISWVAYCFIFRCKIATLQLPKK